MTHLKPNDPDYDNGPGILNEILSEGVVSLGPFSYHVKECVIPEGVCGTIEGWSGGYRNVHSGLTQIRPTSDWDGTSPLITWSELTPGRATARNVHVKDVRFVQTLTDNEAVSRTGIGLQFKAADVWVVERCEFWGWETGLEAGDPGQPLVNLSVRDSIFVSCHRGFRNVTGVPTIACIWLANNHFQDCGKDDASSPGGGAIIQGGAAHCIGPANRFEDNLGRGLRLHDVKETTIQGNYFEDNPHANMLVTASGSGMSAYIGPNSWDASGYTVNSPAKAYKLCACET